MIPDPIVEEVRQARDEIAQVCDYDIAAIFDHLRRFEATSDVPHVSLAPRPLEPEQRPSTE